MKKCPTCEKTFEDSMRFCQVDGTPLVDDAPAFDPYATVVASAGDVAPAEPAAPEPAAPAEERIEISMGPIDEPEEVLDLPQADPLKTMYVSEDEMRKALGQVDDADEPVMEIPPIAEPEPPKFAEPEIASPIFGDIPPAASPYAVTESAVDVEPEPEPAFDSTNPPIPPPSFDSAPTIAAAPESQADEAGDGEAATVIQPEPPPFQAPEPPPSPFQAPEPPPSPFQASEPAFEPAPEPPPFKEPEPATPSFGSSSEQASSPAEWTPPPAPDASWQNQEIGQNTPFQPPVAGTAGQNKTLAIISLVTGIVSILCCSSIFVVGLGAIVMGFMAKSKADGNPSEFGGSGLAWGGIITGGISLVIGILYWIMIFTGVIALPRF